MTAILLCEDPEYYVSGYEEGLADDGDFDEEDECDV